MKPKIDSSGQLTDHGLTLVEWYHHDGGFVSAKYIGTLEFKGFPINFYAVLDPKESYYGVSYRDLYNPDFVASWLILLNAALPQRMAHSTIAHELLHVFFSQSPLTFDNTRDEEDIVNILACEGFDEIRALIASAVELFDASFEEITILNSHIKKGGKA